MMHDIYNPVINIRIWVQVYLKNKKYNGGGKNGFNQWVQKSQNRESEMKQKQNFP